MSNERTANVDEVPASNNGRTRNNRTKRCIVCHTTEGHIGKNYGAITCIGCCKFFRYHNTKTPGNMVLKPCQGSNDCRITHDNRRGCQYCRMAQCIKSGMVWSVSETPQEDSDTDAQVVAEDRSEDRQSIQVQQPSFGPKTSHKLRGIFLGTEEGDCVSIEEYRMLMMRDEFSGGPEKDVSRTGSYEPGIMRDHPTSESVENRKRKKDGVVKEENENYMELLDNKRSRSLMKTEDDRLLMMSERLSLEAHAIYSDSVHLDRDDAVVLGVEMKEDIPEVKVGKKESVDMNDDDFESQRTLPSNRTVLYDTIVAGFNMQAANIVTSTPCHSFVEVPAYFGNSNNLEPKPNGNAEFALPRAPTALMNRMKHRRSMKPKDAAEVKVVENPEDEAILGGGGMAIGSRQQRFESTENGRRLSDDVEK